MIAIELTRFFCGPRSYSRADSYIGCWKTEPDDNCHPIVGYMSGAIDQMKRFDDQPEAWSFGKWKPVKSANNHAKYWLSASAIGLEYRGSDLTCLIHEPAAHWCFGFGGSVAA